LQTEIPAYSQMHTYSSYLEKSPDFKFKVANPHVYKNYKRGLPCYPRSSFDSLISHLSTQYVRVTITDFRLYSTCQSRNQACLYYYALHAVSDSIEHTFCSLALLFSQTSPQVNCPFNTVFISNKLIYLFKY
jgi:hypothetical protein